MLRLLIGCSAIVLLLAVASPAFAADEPPPAAPPATVDEPPPPEPPPAEEPAEREQVRPEGRPLPGRGIGPRVGIAGGGRPGMRGVRRPDLPLAPLMRMLAEHRPELARRLERVRREDPERFERILMDALAPRIERALDAAERPPIERGDAPPREERLGPPAQAEFEQRMRALHEEEEHLEMRSHELADRLRDLRREKRDPEAGAGLRRELLETIQRHFDVRGELRRVEVEQIERELRGLHERLEQLQQGLERRERQREDIIRRRAHELLGDEDAGW